MPDSKAKRGKQDRARVSLGQEHEREYLQAQLTVMLVELRRAKGQFVDAYEKLDAVTNRVGALSTRLRSGFPAAQKKARRGK